MLFQYARMKTGKLKHFFLILFGAFSLLAGMGGLRQVTILHLPMLLAALLLTFFNYKNHSDNYTYAKRYCGYIGFIFIMSFLGYLLNSKILSKIYHFKSWEDISYKNFAIDSFINVLNGMLHSFGYKTDKVFSAATILNGFSVLLLLLMVWSLYRGISKKFNSSIENQLLSFYLLSAIIVFVGLYVFTDLQYADRYNLPILVFSIPVISINLKELECKKCLKQLGGITFVAVATICSLFNYREYKKIDTTKELREITEYLSDIDIPVGYATFWNANVLTELSDGYIEVYSYLPGNNINQLFEWLQLTSHETEKPQGKTFALFKKDEYEGSPLKPFFEKMKPTYNTDNYMLYCFESYDSLLYLLTNYTFDFSGNQWLINGEDRDNIREIYRDGISYGPYIALYPGVYEVSILGKNLDVADFSCVFNSGNDEINIHDFSRNDSQVTYRVYLMETINDAETRIHNITDKPVSVSKITIQRIGTIPGI